VRKSLLRLGGFNEPPPHVVVQSVPSCQDQGWVDHVVLELMRQTAMVGRAVARFLTVVTYDRKIHQLAAVETIR